MKTTMSKVLILMFMMASTINSNRFFNKIAAALDHEENIFEENSEFSSADNNVLIPNTYLVEFDRSTDVRNAQKTIVDFLQKSHGLPRSAITMRQLISSSLFHGASFSMNGRHSIGMIKSIPGTVTVYPVYSVPGPKSLTEYIRSKSRNNNSTVPVIAHDLTGVDKVHEQMKNFGNGVRVKETKSSVMSILLRQKK